jgi:hypothetical protein
MPSPSTRAACTPPRGPRNRAVSGRPETGVPDDATALATSEHVARTNVSEEPVDGIEFRFSFGAVSHAGDDGQGTLRQAVLNANMLAGPNEIRLVRSPSPRPAHASGGRSSC